ncbi:MAG: hypothetical protein DRP67_00430 [Candidatus Omnitrophota bacterium]|nr:MAG: hypothetical protein DRP67_00430 [Candidatus Omnitrophota bacterium]
MVYGIISDIHGNLEALQKVIGFLKGKIDKLIVIGDVVGYGPNPNECLELLYNENPEFTLGNHEEGILKGDLSNFSEDARISLEWTISNLSPENFEKIKRWPEKIEKGDILFLHASPSNPTKGYILSQSQAKRAFQALEKRLCFNGHTHFPICFRKKQKEEKVEVIPCDFSGSLKVKIEENYIYMINVGSVGQPRDGFPFACAGIYDDEKKIFELFRIEYPVEITKEKILEKGLPSSLAGRLLRGL